MLRIPIGACEPICDRIDHFLPTIIADVRDVNIRIYPYPIKFIQWFRVVMFNDLADCVRYSRIAYCRLFVFHSLKRKKNRSACDTLCDVPGF
jgi:hypothetical protein